MGDMNVKLGEQKSKGGKLLENLVKKRNLVIMNKMPKCVGKWTQKNTKNQQERSEIDYIICNKELYEKVMSMNIDEEGKDVLTKYKITEKATEVIESDHMMMTLTYVNSENKEKLRKT